MIDERIFNNRYRLGGKLGEGGMATVFSGTDTLLRRRVAIKVLREQYAADQEFVRRFYQEAESAARLSHPNIVNTYDVGREGDTYYIVMELVDGSSLAEIIAADGKLPEPVALDYAAQIASGLAYAHRVGLLHRDIKPANILITKDDVVKLSDFGIARAVSEHTMTLTKPGLVMGSVYYISPEQAQGHELHDTSDLYSLGVVLYQMLTGTLPFSGESPVTVALKHIGDPVPTIDTRRSGVSPALAAIVNKVLQKKPEHRFASASDLASALREARERPAVAGYRLADDAPTQTSRLSRSLPPRRSPLPDRPYADRDAREEHPQRRGWIVAVLAAFLVAATAGGYYLFGRPLPNFATTVAVANYTNMADVQAQQAIVNAGLRVRFVKSPSDTVAANHVIRQNPPPGTAVARDALIELVVSNGKPLVGLLDVRGYSALDAQRTLQAQGFAVTHGAQIRQQREGQRHRSAAQGRNSGAAGEPRHADRLQRRRAGRGPELRRHVGRQGPRCRGARGHPARHVATGGNCRRTGRHDRLARPARGSASAKGRGRERGREHRRAKRTRGRTGRRNDADRARRRRQEIPRCDRCDFEQPASGRRYSSKSPPAVTERSSASSPRQRLSCRRVRRSRSCCRCRGEVPDTEGMTVEAARATLSAYGYGVAQTRFTTSAGAGGRVVGTDPETGTTLSPGSAVVLIVNGAGPP